MTWVFVEFEHVNELDDIVCIFDVTCRVNRPRRAVLHGHPDQQAPAEGGEVEDVQVWDDGQLVPPKYYGQIGIDSDSLEQQARKVAFERWAE